MTEESWFYYVVEGQRIILQFTWQEGLCYISSPHLMLPQIMVCLKVDKILLTRHLINSCQTQIKIVFAISWLLCHSAGLLSIFINSSGKNNSLFYIVWLCVAIFRLIMPTLNKDFAVACPGLWTCIRGLSFDSDVELLVLSEDVVLSGQMWLTSMVLEKQLWVWG